MKTKKKLLYLCYILAAILAAGCISREGRIVMTVNGPLPADKMGITLTHEHVLVDFTGADSIDNSRWDRREVTEAILPYLTAVKEAGCRTFIECTPAYLGRDPQLLKRLSDSAGINIITNTGYYGASGNKYLPSFVMEESAEELAARWIDEWNNGIEGTGIRPGFIKIGVEGDSLSELHGKLVRAAALAHLASGLTIASHTGNGSLAFEELDVLRDEKVAPDAFIWVHAQNEKDLSRHVSAARMGAWISFDGIGDDNVEEYATFLKNMKDHNVLGKVLLSHDAGWYHPGEKGGGKIRGYVALFSKLLPLLVQEGFTRKEIDMMIITNPADAFQIRIRKL